MNRSRWLIALGVAAAAGVAWLAWPGSDPGRPGGAAPATPQQLAAGTARPLPVGAAGCAAQACHGGWPSADPGPRSAATVWLTRDRHRQAYQVLDGPKSQGIMRNLAGDGLPADARQDARCLACHTVPTSVYAPGRWGTVDPRPEAHDLRAQGVACDACHGPAERFDYPHLAWSKSDNREQTYRDGGAVWLSDPVSRARVCVGCHVGAPPDRANNLPARDVTHDLIAAGHPRLTFELSLFLANLPPHWQEIDRTKPLRVRREPDAARTWYAGQLGTAEASLRLLAHQAKPGPADPTLLPWPELARFDCSACHHNLTAPSWRQERGSGGRLTPNSWNLSWPLRRLLGQDDPESAPAIDQLRAALARSADRAAVADRALRLERRIGRRLDALRNDPAGAGTDRTLAAFRAGAGQLDRLNWDDAAQLYYALEALSATGPGEPALRAALALPPDADGPVEFRPSDAGKLFRLLLGE
jgi:hypothetical protein